MQWLKHAESQDQQVQYREENRSITTGVFGLVKIYMLHVLLKKICVFHVWTATKGWRNIASFSGSYCMACLWDKISRATNRPPNLWSGLRLLRALEVPLSRVHIAMFHEAQYMHRNWTHLFRGVAKFCSPESIYELPNLYKDNVEATT